MLVKQCHKPPIELDVNTTHKKESIFKLTLLTSRLLYNALYLMDPAIAPIEVWWVLVWVVICPFEKDVFGSIGVVYYLIVSTIIKRLEIELDHLIFSNL